MPEPITMTLALVMYGVYKAVDKISDKVSDHRARQRIENARARMQQTAAAYPSSADARQLVPIRDSLESSLSSNSAPPTIAEAVEKAAQELETTIKLLKKDMTSRNFTEAEQNQHLRTAEHAYYGNMVDNLFSELGASHGRQLGASINSSRRLTSRPQGQPRGGYISDQEYDDSDMSSLWRS